MTDSIILFASTTHITMDKSSAVTLPFKINEMIDNHGEIKNSNSIPVYVKSPLTKAHFKVTPIFIEELEKKSETLLGYEVSINVPACVIGNNALLQILVYWCCLFALYFLKWYLLRESCDPNIVKQLDLEHCEIKFVALTYLINCNTREEAIALNLAISNYGEATLNTHHKNPKQKKPITVWSSNGLSTVIITKHRHFEAESYVKCGPTPRSFEHFPSTQIRNLIYEESQHQVRLELNADHRFLKPHGFQSPLAWKSKAQSAAAHRLGLNAIRDYLSVSDNLRSKRPKPVHMASLSPAEKTILLDYFNGIDPKKHPQLQSKSAQYFSKLKRNLEKKLRIDITIPWSIHSSKISPHLPKLLQFTGEYVAPPALINHCFVRETARSKLKQLRQILVSLQV